MDNLYHRLIFYLDNKNEIPGKNFVKVLLFQNLLNSPSCQISSWFSFVEYE